MGDAWQWQNSRVEDYCSLQGISSVNKAALSCDFLIEISDAILGFFLGVFAKTQFPKKAKTQFGKAKTQFQNRKTPHYRNFYASRNS